jgi:hypothetical protein
VPPVCTRQLRGRFLQAVSPTARRDLVSLNSTALQVDDEVVEGRLPSVQAVQELRPLSAVAVHADAVLHGRNDPQAKQAGRALE